MKKQILNIPLYIQVASAVRDEIKKGLLFVGECVSHRKISERYGVSKKTAADALEILHSEGLVISKPRVGSFVNDIWSPLLGKRAPAWEEIIRNSSSVPSSDKIYSIYQLISSNPKNHLGGTAISKDFNFHKPVKTAMERVIHRMSVTDDFYNMNFMGMPSLRENIVKHMALCGIHCESKDVLVTTGPMEALSLVLLSLLRHGMKLFIEETSILGGYTFARFTGADIRRVKCDDDGMLEDDLIEQTRKVKSNAIVCISPANQYPTGSILSKSRRDLIMSACISKDIPIIEYDMLRDFNRGLLPKPFKSFDKNDHVIYIGSFISSYRNMKIGWIIAPHKILKHIADTKTQYEININTIVQMVADEMFTSNAYCEYVEEYTPIFMERLKLCRTLFEKYFSNIAVWGKNTYSFYQWLRFSPHIDTYKVLKFLKNTFVHSGFFFNPDDINKLYISPVGDSAQNLDNGLKEIADAIRVVYG